MGTTQVYRRYIRTIYGVYNDTGIPPNLIQTAEVSELRSTPER